MRWYKWYVVKIGTVHIYYVWKENINNNSNGNGNNSSSSSSVILMDMPFDRKKTAKRSKSARARLYGRKRKQPHTSKQIGVQTHTFTDDIQFVLRTVSRVCCQIDVVV